MLSQTWSRDRAADEMLIHEMEQVLLGMALGIEILEKQLAKAHQQHDSFQRQLELLKQRARPAWIQLCPTEVLSLIFRETVGNYDRFNLNLMLVCKKWHPIVMKDPLLWNTIRIKVPSDTNMQEWANKAVRFIQAYTERSGSCLLDVELDCSGAHSRKLRLAEMMSRGIGAYQHWPDDMSRSNLQAHILGNGLPDLTNNDEMFHSFCPSHILPVMAALVGKNGVNMARWRRLCLDVSIFQEANLTQALWKKLAYATPNLVDLAVRHHRCEGSLQNSRCYLPDLSSLQILDLCPLRDWKEMPINPKILHTLKVFPVIGRPFSNDLSAFVHLQILHVTESTAEKNIARERPEDLTLVEGPAELRRPFKAVRLPQLKRLKIFGTFRARNFQQFDLPELDLLEFQGQFLYASNWSRQFSPGDIRDQARQIRIYWGNDKYFDKAQALASLFPSGLLPGKAHTIKFVAVEDDDGLLSILTPLLADARVRFGPDTTLKHVFLWQKFDMSKTVDVLCALDQ